MDLRKLQKLAVDALDDIKAKDIDVINTTRLTSLFDRIIIASGDSNRQVKALARNVAEKVRAAGGHVIGVEGEEGGEWVLVDLGDIVVHVMQPAVRAFYNIEELWTAKPKGRRKDGVEEPTAIPSDSPGKSARSTPVKKRSAVTGRQPVVPVARRVSSGRRVTARNSKAA